MRVTPLDIRNHAFQRRLSGYDREEVNAFLRMVAEDYETVLREAESQRVQVDRLQARVDDLTGNESILKETLTTAQKLSEDLRGTAVKEAEALVGQAEVRAEKLLDAAHRRVAKLAEDIREMKMLRSRIATSVRSAIETHLRLLEGLADDVPEDPILEGKVAYLSANAQAAKQGKRG